MKQSDEEVIQLLREAFETGDLERVEDIVEENYEDSEENLYEVAFRMAVKMGCYSYVEDHCDDVEINDLDGGEYSSYLDETQDEEIIELLIAAGALRSLEEYSEYTFAIDSVSESVLAFDPVFQEKVFEKLIKKIGLKEKEVIEILSLGTADEYELTEKLCLTEGGNLEDVCNLIKAKTDGDSIDLEEFDYMDTSVDIWSLKELVENLGWRCEFNGDQNGFETNGVYFIE